jgi:hypothetical protein
MVREGFLQTGKAQLQCLEEIPLIFIDPGIDPIATITVVRVKVKLTKDGQVCYEAKTISKTISSAFKYQTASMHESFPKKFADCQGTNSWGL